MAPIPNKRQLGALPGLGDVPMVSAPRDFISPAIQNFGRGISGVGETLQRNSEFEKRKTDAIGEADRQNEFNSQMGAFEDTLKTDTDYSTQPKRFEEQQTKVKDTLLSGIQDPYEREQARVKFDTLGLAYKNRIETNVQAGQRDIARATTQKVVNDGLEIAAKPGVDPTVHDQTILATHNALVDARDKGVISAQEYETQNRAFTDGYRERQFGQKLDTKLLDFRAGKPPMVASGQSEDNSAINPQARQVLSSVLAKDKDVATHVDGLKPRFANNLATMFESAPPEIKSGLGILSGHRTAERQTELWNASDKSGRTVGSPDGSRHVHGDAADLSFNGMKLDDKRVPQEVRDWVKSNAPKFGLGLPMDGKGGAADEPWHVEDWEARPASTPYGAKVREAIAGIRPDLMAASSENRAKQFPAISPQEFFGPGVDVSTLPAGLRNNNPGNIKYVKGSALPGITGPSQNTDQGDPQAVFSSPQAGATAAAQLALRKFDGGKTTVRQIIAAKGGWTPGNDAAAQNIAKYAGLDPDQALDLRKDPKQLTSLMRGIFMQEQGDQHAKYDDGLLASAAGAALGGEPVKFASGGGSQAATRPWAPADDPDYQNLSYAARERVDRQWAQTQTAFASQAREETEARTNALNLDIIDGKAGRADVDAAREAGWLNDAGKVKSMYDAVEKRDKDVAAAGQAEAAYANPNYAWNPGEKSDRDNVERIIGANNGEEKLAARDQDFVNNTVMPVARRTGILAPQVEAQISQAGRASDPNQVMWGMGLAARLQMEAPDAFGKLSEGVRDKVDTFNAYRNFDTPEQLARRLNQPDDPAAVKVRTELRKQALVDVKKEVQTDDVVDKVAGGGWFKGDRSPTDPSVLGRFRSEFDNVYADVYGRTGDKTIAMSRATERMAQRWGVSDVNSGRLMVNPPEKNYPTIGGSHDWMTKQIKSDLFDEAKRIRPDAVKDASRDVDLTKLGAQLVPDAQTEADLKAGSPASYPVVVKNSWGAYEVLTNDKNRPLRMTFDPKPFETEELARTQKKEDAPERRRAIREQLRDPNFDPFPQPSNTLPPRVRGRAPDAAR